MSSCSSPLLNLVKDRRSISSCRILRYDVWPDSSSILLICTVMLRARYQYSSNTDHFFGLTLVAPLRQVPSCSCCWNGHTSCNTRREASGLVLISCYFQEASFLCLSSMSCSYGCGQGGSLSFRLSCPNSRFPLKDFSPPTSVSFLRALLTPHSSQSSSF